MSTRAYGRTSWPWGAAAVLLFWQTWYLCHVYATERSGVRWTCDDEGCATDQLAGGALFLAAPSAVGAALLAAPYLGGSAATGLAALLAAFGFLAGREDDHAVFVGYGLAALGTILLAAGAVRGVRGAVRGARRGPRPDGDGSGYGAGDGGAAGGGNGNGGGVGNENGGAVGDGDPRGGPSETPAPAPRLPLGPLLWTAVAPGTLAVAVPAAVAATAFLHGALDGPRWAMVLGLNVTAALLFLLARLRLGHRPGV
ncbi:hypothetical protein BU196_30680, partial [Streptomyces sp. CBMA370]|nr:hypothetical protein [Streptomyces sp. CBMA370]